MASLTHGHGGKSHNRVGMNSLGLWFFFISETFLFAALLSARFFISGTERPEHLDQELGLLITSILLVSSLTAYMAEVSIARGKRGLCSLFIVLTILLGIVFFGGVVLEWSTAEFSQSEPYGTAFFSMTGLHATHVLSGVFMLGMVLLLLLRGSFSSDSHWGVEATIKYWHFVDVVWVFFYPALYLVG